MLTQIHFLEARSKTKFIDNLKNAALKMLSSLSKHRNYRQLSQHSLRNSKSSWTPSRLHFFSFELICWFLPIKYCYRSLIKWHSGVDLNPSKKKSTWYWDQNMRTTFRTLFLNWYKKHVRFIFRTCFGTVIYVRACGQPGVKSVPFMVPDLWLAHPGPPGLRNDPV
jgi:hypothetical protein